MDPLLYHFNHIMLDRFWVPHHTEHAGGRTGKISLDTRKIHTPEYMPFWVKKRPDPHSIQGIIPSILLPVFSQLKIIAG